MFSSPIAFYRFIALPAGIRSFRQGDTKTADMRIDVASLISELLYEHDSVIIPGLGGFVSQYKPATIDQVQGTVYPPSKDLDFNDHLVINDGLLVNAIKVKYKLSQEEARRTMEEFVKDVQALVSGQEMYKIPKVGRLYRDYEGHIQLLPDTTNFNADMYGLPAVQFYPALKKKEDAPVATAVAVPATSQAGKATAKLAGIFQRALPFVVGLVVVIIAWSIYLAMQTRTPATAEATPPQFTPTSELTERRINQRPISSSTEEMEGEQATYDANTGVPNTTSDDDEVEKGVNTESPTIAPNQREGIIVIGKFGNQDNARNLIQQLSRAGYSPYSDKDQGLTRVGIQFLYEDERELQQKLQNVRQKFEKNAWVLKR